MARQYPAIKFSKTDKRTYTYHWDGEPLKLGEMVDVEGRGGKPISVEVLSIEHAKPPFATKAILRRSPPKIADELDLENPI